MEVHVGSLRGKLGDPDLVQTVAGSATGCGPSDGTRVRRRLVASYLLLMGLVLLALEMPLGLVLVSRDTQGVAADRLADATRFASLPRRRCGTGLAELPRRTALLREVYGIDAAVVDQEQQVVTPAGLAARTAGTGAAARTSARRRTSPDATRDDLALARRADVVGGAGHQRRRGGRCGGHRLPHQRAARTVTAVWLILGGAGLLALVACVVAAFAWPGGRSSR